MTIDADVATVAKHFGLDPRLIQAVVNAEGNIVKAVQCSIPSVKDRAEALEITCRSCAHALCDYVQQDSVGRGGFVMFWANRWAPKGAANDPKNLNANWPGNVLRGWASA